MEIAGLADGHGNSDHHDGKEQNIVNDTYERSSEHDEQESDEEEQRADPTRTKLSGQGLNGGHAASDLNFLVHAHDFSGSKCQQGGDDVVVKLLPSSQSMQLTGPINVSVVDNENGIYSVSYRVPDKGSYMLHVEINYLPITGSPFPLFIGAPMTQAEEDEAAAAAAKAPPSSATAANTTVASSILSALAKTTDDPSARTVYVSGLSTSVSLDHYRQLLAIQGRIKGIKMVGSDVSSGVLVVEFSLPTGAEAALKMNGLIVGTRPLLVQSTAVYLMHQNAIANATNAIRATTTTMERQKAESALKMDDILGARPRRRSRSRSRDGRRDDGIERQKDRDRPRSRERERDRPRSRERHRDRPRSRSRDRVDRYQGPPRDDQRPRDDRHSYKYRGDRRDLGPDRERDRYREREREREWSRSRSRDRRGRDENPDERDRRKKEKKEKKEKHKKREKDDTDERN